MDLTLISIGRHRHSEGGGGSKETSSCAATATGAASSSASSHHHHHHHHHHHAASRRAKNRSRKKKPSRTVSSAASSAITGTANENEVVIKHHDPPTHQHSAASLLTSVAAASLAMTSIEAIKEPLQATVATESSSKNPLPMTESTQTMETKCTQTKLDEEDHAAATLLLDTASRNFEDDQQQQQPPSLPASNEPEPAEVEGVVKEEVTSLMPSQKETEMGCNNPEQQQQAVNPQATAATESKGEMATWTSSTEVCPWEDE